MTFTISMLIFGAFVFGLFLFITRNKTPNKDITTHSGGGALYDYVQKNPSLNPANFKNEVPHDQQDLSKNNVDKKKVLEKTNVSRYCKYCNEKVFENQKIHQCKSAGSLAINDDSDFLLSMVIGAATDSALLGGLLGGDLTGGIIGDSLDGDLFD